MNQASAVPADGREWSPVLAWPERPLGSQDAGFAESRSNAGADNHKIPLNFAIVWIPEVWIA